jgi:pimeloyl-ACP methyl ester carboxylesterase
MAYARLPATGQAKGTIVFLSGGPGQAGIPLAPSYAGVLAHVRSDYELVFPDQRGSGQSGAVECDAPPSCAAALGERRAFFNTPQTAADIEDLRRALGVERVTLFGVSYGTVVAEEYARRYPERTAALILDSPVGPDGIDILDHETVRTTPRMLREVCTKACRRSVGDPARALDRAVARLPVRGPYVHANGRAEPVTFTEEMLLQAIQTADFQDVLRAELPAAIASLAAGDAAPLIHALDFWRPAEDETTVVNLARRLAGACTEGRSQPGPFGPFSSMAARAMSSAPMCDQWPRRHRGPRSPPRRCPTSPRSCSPAETICGRRWRGHARSPTATRVGPWSSSRVSGTRCYATTGPAAPRSPSRRSWPAGRRAPARARSSSPPRATGRSAWPTSGAPSS